MDLDGSQGLVGPLKRVVRAFFLYLVPRCWFEVFNGSWLSHWSPVGVTSCLWRFRLERVTRRNFIFCLTNTLCYVASLDTIVFRGRLIGRYIVLNTSLDDDTLLIWGVWRILPVCASTDPLSLENLGGLLHIFLEDLPKQCIRSIEMTSDHTT